MKIPTSLVMAALICAASVRAIPAEEQAAIPFINQAQSIRSWHADTDEALWIEDARQQWYYARLQAPCHGLKFAVRLGFEPRSHNSLDRFGVIHVPGEGRCQILSLVRSSEPPKKS